MTQSRFGPFRVGNRGRRIGKGIGRPAPADNRFRQVHRRRLRVEPLEPRTLLAALAVAANSSIFDTTSAAPHSEVNNLVAELAAQGHAVSPFSDLSAAGIAAALAGTDAVVIPEQEVASLNATLTPSAKAALAGYVSSGHGMIVAGSPAGRAESLLAGLFGFSIAAAADPTAGVSFLDDVDSVGTAFATGPIGVVNFVTKVTAFDATSPASFPAGTRLIYKFGSTRTVGLFPYGQGQIVYFGYDFDDPAGQPASAGWKTVLGLAVAQVAVAPPTTSVEIVGADLVISDVAGTNDAFSLSANAAQWTITIDSGKFAAASPIPGVTVGEKTIAIDKSTAATFTGRFLFAGGGGNDVLSVKLDDLGRDVHFDGGETTGDHDLLKVSSLATLASLTAAPNTSGGGLVDIGSDGDPEITYASLEPVDLTGITVDELDLVVPAGATADLNDYLAPTDGFSQLSFGGTGPEDQYFRHPTQRLGLHTSGASLVTLFPLDPTAEIPQLDLSGTAGDMFRMGATSGIRAATSLTLVDATLDLNGQSPTIDGLSGTGGVTNSADTNSVLTIGAQGAGGDFAGAIVDGWPTGPVPPATRRISLVKAGDGSQRLTGAHTFSGATEIAAGVLVLDGSFHEHSQIIVRGSAILSGVGDANGPLAVETGGRIEPGSPGNLPGSHGGVSETWNAGSHFAVQLGGPTPGSEYDQRRIGGTVSLAGAILDVSLFGGYLPAPQPPTALTIVDNLGAAEIDGVFAGLPEGAAVNVPGSPVPLFITYQGGDGNDIVLYSAAGSQIVGSGGDDTLVLRRQGVGAADSELEYSLNGAPFVPLDDVESLSLDLGAGSDLVTLDFVYGDPVPPDGLQVDGGDPAAAAPGDRLVLLGAGDATEAVYRPGGTAGQQGTIELAGDGDGIIELAGLEAIDATALAQVTLATPAADNDLGVSDATDAGSSSHAALRIGGSSGAGTIVPLHVWSVDRVVVDTTAGGGADDVTVVSAAGGHGVGNFRSDTGSESGDRTVIGVASIAGDLVIDSGVIRIGGAVTAGGSIGVTSHGLLTVDAPLAAQGPVTLTTTDEPGLDADLAIEAAVSSSGAGLVLRSADHAIVRGPLSAATTIDVAIDTPNSDPGEGNTLFLRSALVAPGGTTAAGHSDADRFEIEPQTGSTLFVSGGLPAGSLINSQSQNALAGDEAGDELVLDMTTAGNGQAVLGPVTVDSVGGRAVAENTLPITYRGIEDLDLFDGGALTTAQQGDFYLRGTDRDEMIYVEHDGAIENPRFRVSVQGRMFPGNQGYFGPYIRGRSVIVFARGGRDVVDLSSVPLAGELHGETGDDYLAGASFGDLLVGGPGGDTLIGGSQGAGDELWGDDFDPIPRDEAGQPVADPTPEQLLQNRDWWARRFSPTDGNDKLYTAGGDDRLYGQGGDDRLGADAGDDYASGGSGNDLVSGGDGNDRLYGNGGNDVLAGDEGNDLLSGGDGNDLLLGRGGSDVLIGGGGADNLNGHEGNDLLFAGRVALAGGDEDSTAAGDASDAALLAVLLEWSTLGQAAGASSAGDDGELDWLYGGSGSDRFVGDGTSQNYDFAAGVDEAG